MRHAVRFNDGHLTSHAVQIRTAVRPAPGPLSVGVIGCGAVVEGLYLSALRKVEARGLATITTLVDPNVERAAKLAHHFGRARSFASVDDALNDRVPDLVIVASPAGHHAASAIAALDAGSAVLCEKPMTVSLGDADRMLAAARDARRVLAVGMVRRTFPSAIAARELIGSLGDDLRFVYREGQVYSWPVSTDAAFRRSTAGGGVLADFGSHALDLLASLFGPPTVEAYADDGRDDGVETNCRVELSFARARGSAQLSWSQPLVTGLHVVGRRGELFLHPTRPDELRLRRDGAWTRVTCDATWPLDLRLGGRRATPRTYYDCIFHEVVLALRAAAFGEPVPATGEDGRIVVGATEACYARATPLELPWLSEDEMGAATSRHWTAERWAA
jgi:predicted dehydrogenase